MQDILAHVTTWEEEALRVPAPHSRGRHAPALLDDLRRDRRLQRPDDGPEGAPFASPRYSHSSTTCTAGVVALVQSAPEAEIASDTRFRRRLRLDTYSHYPKHAEAIDGARRSTRGSRRRSGRCQRRCGAARAARISARTASRVAAGIAATANALAWNRARSIGREAEILDERGQLLAQRATEHGGVIGIDREPHAPLVQPANRVCGQALDHPQPHVGPRAHVERHPSAARRSTSASSSAARTPCSIRVTPSRSSAAATEAGPISSPAWALVCRPRRRASAKASTNDRRLLRRLVAVQAEPVQPGRAQHRLDHRGRRALGLVLRERGEDARDQARRLRGLDGRHDVGDLERSAPAPAPRRRRSRRSERSGRGAPGRSPPPRRRRRPRRSGSSCSRAPHHGTGGSRRTGTRPRTTGDAREGLGACARARAQGTAPSRCRCSSALGRARMNSAVRIRRIIAQPH